MECDVRAAAAAAAAAFSSLQLWAAAVLDGCTI